MIRLIGTLSLSAALLLPASLLAQNAAPAQNLPTKRVLIHVYSDKPEQWKAAVEKANELVSSTKPYDTYVEILATGDGLKLVDKSNPLSSEVKASLNKDVSFVACHASMVTNHMGIDQLDAGVGTVPSGGREMTMRKAEGWTMMDDQAKK